MDKKWIYGLLFLFEVGVPAHRSMYFNKHVIMVIDPTLWEKYFNQSFADFILPRACSWLIFASLMVICFYLVEKIFFKAGF